MSIQILEKPVSMDYVRELAVEWYGIMIKGTVDITQNKVAIGGDYHLESCELLVKNGSDHINVCGFSIRFEENQNGVLEFDSLVNIKPSLGTKSRSVENPEIVKRATAIIHSYIQFAL